MNGSERGLSWKQISLTLPMVTVLLALIVLVGTSVWASTTYFESQTHHNRDIDAMLVQLIRIENKLDALLAQRKATAELHPLMTPGMDDGDNRSYGPPAL